MPSSTEIPTTAQPEELRDSLLRWFRTNKRDLPWRRNRSIYSVVVSEFMLQQTQVSTMLPYFDRWMEKLPDFESLAAADESVVLSLWQGLGYYSRARNLRKLAQTIIAHGVPQTTAEWRKLPGVGPYTAAAIHSMGQDGIAAVVDGNVVRVLARLAADDRAFNGTQAAVDAFTARARAFLNEDHPGEHNEAMMELGATICLPRRPACLLCPLSIGCHAYAQGIQDSIPRIVRPSTQKITVQRLWAQRDGKLLLSRIDKNARRLAGFLELPQLSDLDVTAIRQNLLAVKRRAISNQQIREEIYTAPVEPYPAPGKNLVWAPIAELEHLPLSGPHRRWINELLKANSQG